MTRDRDHLPRVSIVVPTYNGGPHYLVCFEALCQLDYPPERLEVHVIDDCSTDGTREYLQRQSPPDFVRLYFPDINMRRARARNLALGCATGEVIILLDGDMEVKPDFVREHVAELSKPGRTAVIGRIEPAPWLPKSRLNHYLYASKLRGARQFGPNVHIGFQYLLTGNVALSREALEAGGAFEESFYHYGGEDTLFAYRVARKFPHGIFYSDKPVSYHHEDRPLSVHLGLLRDYGCHNLPQIVSRHPEIANTLAADFAWPLTGNYSRYKRALGLVLFNPLTYFLSRALLPVTPFPISNVLVRFLFVAAVVRGLRRYVRKQNGLFPDTDHQQP
ncbi:MAG: glycosyltransferase [Calditrichaeota bacterium]|nr:glycosyltransferase [Calditrichota bacterium]